MKAVLQHKGVRFRYTHDLEELGKSIEEAGATVPEAVRNAVILSRYAFETRYPALYEPLTEADYQQAIQLAQAVVLWAESIL